MPRADEAMVSVTQYREGMAAMSLTVPADLLGRAQHGEADDAA
jgi:hypothetical protein